MVASLSILYYQFYKSNGDHRSLKSSPTSPYKSHQVSSTTGHLGMTDPRHHPGHLLPPHHQMQHNHHSPPYHHSVHHQQLHHGQHHSQVSKYSAQYDFTPFWESLNFKRLLSPPFCNFTNIFFFQKFDFFREMATEVVKKYYKINVF